MNVSDYGTDESSLALFSKKLDNGRYNGILNIRNIINHEGIEYSAVLYDAVDAISTHGISCIASQSKDVITDSVSTTYIGRGFEVGIFTTDCSEHAVASINITGSMDRMAIDGICKLTRIMKVHNLDHDVLGIPVYKAVKVNARKLIKHLKKRGWRFLGK